MPRKRQPVRVAPAARYGERQELVAQQKAAPMLDIEDQQRQQQQLQTVTAGPPAPPTSVFGPTQRPAEPITAGVNMGPGRGAPLGADLATDTDLLLQAMIKVYPHPVLLALLSRGR